MRFQESKPNSVTGKTAVEQRDPDILLTYALSALV
jgi:hypothetical protein